MKTIWSGRPPVLRQPSQVLPPMGYNGELPLLYQHPVTAKRKRKKKEKVMREKEGVKKEGEKGVDRHPPQQA